VATDEDEENSIQATKTLSEYYPTDSLLGTDNNNKTCPTTEFVIYALAKVADNDRPCLSYLSQQQHTNFHQKLNIGRSFHLQNTVFKKWIPVTCKKWMSPC